MVLWWFVAVATSLPAKTGTGHFGPTAGTLVTPSYTVWPQIADDDVRLNCSSSCMELRASGLNHVVCRKLMTIIDNYKSPLERRHPLS